MSKNVKNQKDEPNKGIAEAVSKTDLFFKKYSKALIYTGVGLVVVAAIIFSVLQFYIKPMKKEAADQSFVAEQLFRAGNYETALNGDGNSLGFAQLIDEYGITGGKALYFYAGICELQLGNAQNAIDYLNKYKGNDKIISARAQACIGDAYITLENYDKALVHYNKAVSISDNAFAAAYLLKAGLLCEEMGNNAEALKKYEIIKEKYPQTYEGYEIDKYISRIKVNE
jgi:tetratricopeptide (TPR) repeat protein